MIVSMVAREPERVDRLEKEVYYGLIALAALAVISLWELGRQEDMMEEIVKT